MMTACIKEMPKDPIEFLINKMSKPERKFQKFSIDLFLCFYVAKRIIIVTPPGSKGGEIKNHEE